jgi:hypothetical protein
MTTPPPEGTDPAAPPAQWAAPGSEPVSLAKGTEPDAAPDFDPYRFGAPEHPVPPEYAPPGYRPPPAFAPPPRLAPPQYHPGQPYPGQPYPGQPYPGQPYPGQPYPPPPPGYLPYPPPVGHGKATASLVLGIASIVLCWLSVLDIVPIVLAVVFGILGITEAGRRPNREGRRLAVAGIVCAAVGAVLATVLTVVIYSRIAGCLDYPSGSSAYSQCINDSF